MEAPQMNGVFMLICNNKVVKGEPQINNEFMLICNKETVKWSKSTYITSDGSYFCYKVLTKNALLPIISMFFGSHNNSAVLTTTE